jgi:hypothetical protein
MLSSYHVIFLENQRAHGYTNPENKANTAKHASIFLLAPSLLKLAYYSKPLISNLHENSCLLSLLFAYTNVLQNSKSLTSLASLIQS